MKAIILWILGNHRKPPHNIPKACNLSISVVSGGGSEEAAPVTQPLLMKQVNERFTGSGQQGRRDRLTSAVFGHSKFFVAGGKESSTSVGDGVACLADN